MNDVHPTGLGGLSKMTEAVRRLSEWRLKGSNGSLLKATSKRVRKRAQSAAGVGKNSRQIVEQWAGQQQREVSLTVGNLRRASERVLMEHAYRTGQRAGLRIRLTLILLLGIIFLVALAADRGF